MSRRRYISTKLSLDARVNRLATTAGDFAALLYTWMIPHAEDDGCLSGDPEELLMQVMPGRRDKSVENVADALGAMADLGLISWQRGVQVSFPVATFYAYQSYVPADKRRTTPPDDTPSPDGHARAEKQRETARNAAEARQAPQTRVSPSPSPTGQPSLSPSPKLSPQRERETSGANGARVRPAAPLPPSPVKKTTPESDSQQPPPNCNAQLYTAVAQAFGYSPDTPVAQNEWASWIRQLERARASPEQIPERCLVYRQRYGDGIPLTLRALVRHWHELVPETLGGSAHVASATVASAQQALADRRRAEAAAAAQEKQRLANELARELYPERFVNAGASGASANGQSAPAAHVARQQTECG